MVHASPSVYIIEAASQNGGHQFPLGESLRSVGVTDSGSFPISVSVMVFWSL